MRRDITGMDLFGAPLGWIRMVAPGSRPGHEGAVGNGRRRNGGMEERRPHKSTKPRYVYIIKDRVARRGSFSQIEEVIYKFSRIRTPYATAT